MAGLVFPFNPVNGQLYPDPPVQGVNYYIYDAEATTWRLQSSAGTGTGTVTRIDTCSSLTGGPITTTGTLCLSTTGVTAGTYDYATITVDTQGRITYAASNGIGSPGAWTKTGTVIAPTVVGDQVQMSQGTYEVPGLSFVGAPYTGFGSETSNSAYFAVGGKKSITLDEHGAQFIYDGVFPPVWITSNSTALGVAEGFRMDSKLGDYTALSMGFNTHDGIGSATTYLSLSRPVFGYNTNSLSFYVTNSAGNAGAIPNVVISQDGNINTLSRGALRFYDTNNSNYVALRSPDVVGTNVTWSLPAVDGDAGQLIATAGNGSLYWYTVEGTGTVTSIATGTGLSGGPITIDGTISLNKATNFTLGGVRPDGDTIVVDSDGVISSPGAQNWVKIGTTLAPSIEDSLVKVYPGDNVTPGLSFIETAGTGFGTEGSQTLFFATNGHKSAEFNAQGLRLLSPTGSGVPLQITGAAVILTAQDSSGVGLSIGFYGSDGLGGLTAYLKSTSRSLSLSAGSSPALVVSQLGDTNILGQRSLRLYDTDNSNFVALRSPAILEEDVTWTLPATDGTVGQALTTNGASLLGWTTVAGLGTVTSIATGTGLTGGPITTSGTISIAAATDSALGGVKPDNISIVVQPDGTISSPGSQNWSRTGTALSPTVPNDQVQLWPGTASAPGLAFTDSAGTGFGSDGVQSIFFATNNFKSVRFDYTGLSLFDPPSSSGTPLSIYGYSSSYPLQNGIRLQNQPYDYSSIEIGYRELGFLGERTTVWNTGIPIFGTDLRSIGLSIAGTPALVVTTDGNTNITRQGSIRLYNANNTNYSALRSAAIGGNVTWTLPIEDGAVGQLLTTDGYGALGWVTADGSGTITQIDTGIGLTGGPITTTGTISIAAATTSALGGVKPDGTSIVIQEDGTISAPGAQNWTRTGTVISPTVSGDQVQVSLGTVAAPGISFVGSSATGFGIDSYWGFFFAQNNYMPLTLAPSGATFYKTGANSGVPPVIITASPEEEVGEGLRIRRLLNGDSSAMSLGFRTNGAFGEYTSYLSLGTNGFDYRSLSFYGSESATSVYPATPDLVIATDGSIRLPTQRPLRFYDADNTNFVGFKPPAVIGSNVTWTLPAADGTTGQLLFTNGSGILGWTTVAGTGTVTSIATGTGLSGGPITTSGTISLAPATTSVLGGVKPDGTTITILSDGTISAPGTQNWTRTGTVLSPTVAGDQVLVSPGTTAAPGLSFVGALDSQGFGYDTTSNWVYYGNNDFQRIKFTGSGLRLSAAASSNPPLWIECNDSTVYGLAMFKNPSRAQGFYMGFVSGAFGENTFVFNNTVPVFGSGLRSFTFSISETPTFSLTTDGSTNVLAQNSLRLYDTDNSNYVALRAPAVVGTNVTWSLPPADGTTNQVLSTNGSGVLGWTTVAGTGTVTSIATGTGLSGGPITTSGTISLSPATTSVLGGVKPDGTTITILSDGTISAPGTQNWTRAEGYIYPTVSSDIVTVGQGSNTVPSLTFTGSGAGTGFSSGGTDCVLFVSGSQTRVLMYPDGVRLTWRGLGANAPLLITGGQPYDRWDAIEIESGGSYNYTKFSVGFGTINLGAFNEYLTEINLRYDPSSPYNLRSLAFYVSGYGNTYRYPDLIIGRDGNTKILHQGALQFYDSDSSNYVALQSPTVVGTNVTWTLPAADGTANQVLSTNGAGALSWVSAGGTGSVTSVATGTGLTGGPITSSGTISLSPATTSVLGGVKPDGTTITIDLDGTITAVAPSNYWARSGTLLSPAATGDQVQISISSSVLAPGLSLVGSSTTGFGSLSAASQSMFFAVNGTTYLNFGSSGLDVRSSYGQGLKVGGLSTPLGTQGFILQPELSNPSYFNIGFTSNPGSFGDSTAVISTYATGSATRLSISFSANGTAQSGGFPDLIIGTDGNTRLPQQKALQFYDADSSNYVALRSAAEVSTDVTWTLPAADGTGGQVLSTNGTGTLGWIAAGGTGTVSSVAAGTGLTGGTITTSGTIGLATATTSSLGGVKPDGTSITILPDGTISALAAQNWTRTGTVLSPTTVGDQVQASPGTTAAPGLSFTTGGGVGFGGENTQNIFFASNNQKVVYFSYNGIVIRRPPNNAGTPLIIDGDYDSGVSSNIKEMVRITATGNSYGVLTSGFFYKSGTLGTVAYWAFNQQSLAFFVSNSVSSASVPDLVIGNDGNTKILHQGSLQFYETDSINYVAFRAPAVLGANVTWTLPEADGTVGQILSTNGSGTLSWATVGGTGTVTSVATGTGLTGGPITTSGTISLAPATTSVLGGVKPDGTTITILPDGTISAPGTQNWVRTGTVLTPTVTGDQVQISVGTLSAPGLAFVGNPGVGFVGSSSPSEEMTFVAGGESCISLSNGGLTVISRNTYGLRAAGRASNAPLGRNAILLEPLWQGTEQFGIGFSTNPSPFSDPTVSLWTNSSTPARRSISINATNNSGTSSAWPNVVFSHDGNTRIPQRGALRFYDSDSSNYVGFSAPAAVTSNVTWSLPPADGTSGQILITDGSGALSWATSTGVTQNWTKTGTVLSPTVAGDQVQISGGSYAAPGLTVVGNSGVGFGSLSPGSNDMFFAVNGTEYMNFSAGGLQLKAANSVGQAFRIGGLSTPLGIQGFIMQPLYNGNQFFNIGFTTNPAPFGDPTTVFSTYGTGSGTRQSISFNANGNIGSGSAFPDLIIGTDGNTRIPQRKELRFYDADSSNYVGFRAPETVTSGIVWSLPSTEGTTGQVLGYLGSGLLYWGTPAVGTNGSYGALISSAIYEKVTNSFTTTLSPSSGTLTIDTSSSPVIVGTVGASVTTWAFSNVDPASGKSLTFTLILDSNSLYTYGDACTVNGTSVSGGIRWPGGIAPAATNNEDILSFTIVTDNSGVVRVYGSSSLNYS